MVMVKKNKSANIKWWDRICNEIFASSWTIKYLYARNEHLKQKSSNILATSKDIIIQSENKSRKENTE